MNDFGAINMPQVNPMVMGRNLMPAGMVGAFLNNKNRNGAINMPQIIPPEAVPPNLNQPNMPQVTSTPRGYVTPQVTGPNPTTTPASKPAPKPAPKPTPKPVPKPTSLIGAYLESNRDVAALADRLHSGSASDEEKRYWYPKTGWKPSPDRVGWAHYRAGGYKENRPNKPRKRTLSQLRRDAGR